MIQQIKTLEDSCQELDAEVKRLIQQEDEIIRRDEEERLAAQKTHEESINYLKELNADYKRELEQLLSTPKK
jgi:hypothetical protein